MSEYLAGDWLMWLDTSDPQRLKHAWRLDIYTFQHFGHTLTSEHVRHATMEEKVYAASLPFPNVTFVPPKSDDQRWEARNKLLEERMDAMRDILNNGTREEPLLRISERFAATLRRASERWGRYSRPTKLIEECGELIVALSHWRLDRATNEQVLEELADVVICTLNMAQVLGFEDFLGVLKQKLNKMEKQIECAQ